MNHITNTDAAWIAFAVLFPVILYLVFSGYQTKQRMSVHKSVLDKFSRAEDFATFLQSPAGQRFVAELSGSETPARTVMSAIQRGIILCCPEEGSGGQVSRFSRLLRSPL